MMKRSERGGTIQSSLTSPKIGLNGVTFVTKAAHKESMPPLSGRPSGGKNARNQGDLSTVPNEIEEIFGLYSGMMTSDDFGDMTNNHKTVILTRLTKPYHCNQYGKVYAGVILRFIEETGTIVTTRYCNYTSSEYAYNTGGLYDPVCCRMTYIDNCEILLPAFAGDLLTFAAEIVFTSNHTLEVRILVWSENISTSRTCLVCKATVWYVPYIINQDWKISKIPKLQLDARAERDGQGRFDAYKEERRKLSVTKVEYNRCDVNDGKPLHSVKHSESVLTHVASIYDCGAHSFMDCGAILDQMTHCATMVASKHSNAYEVSPTCGYNFHFLEPVPQGNVLIIYGRLAFTSRKLMEIEILVDTEIISDQHMEAKRVASGFFGFLALKENGRAMTVPSLKLLSTAEENRFQEGQRRFESMRKHLKHTENRMSTTSHTDRDIISKKVHSSV